MSNEIANTNNDPQLPAFMQNEEVMGTDDLGQFVRPPRLKIVQAMSKEPFDQWAKGTVVVVPQMVVFADADVATKKGTPFKFVPIFFYPEWVQTNPLSKSPFIRERSLDPTSDLARKAKNRETWVETHPEDPSLVVTNREHLNFVVMPYDHPMEGTLCVLTFARANFRDGTNLAAMIKMRKASIFGQVFEANTKERSNDKGQWYGLDLNISAETPFVTAEEYEVFKALHLELKEAHNTGILQVDYEDVPEGGSETAGDSSEF